MFKVFIQSFTFNHSRFIENALDGFVIQETNFPFVAAIVDDASTDNTPHIITSYLNRHFDTNDSSVAFEEETGFGTVLFARHRTNKNCFFAVILLKENHYSQRKSKLPYLTRWINDVSYIAICEGDDYWTSPLKLQKQVDYLDNHLDCMLSVHSADWRTDDNIYPYGCQDASPKDYSVEELILCGGLHFATASFVYRTELRLDKPEWRRKAAVGDYPLQILAGLHGKVHYIPDKMCVYRFRSEGSWTYNQRYKENNIAFQKNKIEWMNLLDKATDFKYQKAIYRQLFQHYYSLFCYREISFWNYATAVYKTGQKRIIRMIKGFLRVNLNQRFRFLTRLIK